MDEQSLFKSRRFSLLMGLFLIVYSIAGVSVRLDENVTIFGIPLIINYPNLVGFGFLLASIYSTSRYLFYGIIIGITPKKARENLLNNRLPNGNRISTESVSSAYRDIESCRDGVTQEVKKYFPEVKPFRETKCKVSQEGKFYKFEIDYSKSTAVLAWLQGFDHWLPIWVKIAAIISFIFSLILLKGN